MPIALASLDIHRANHRLSWYFTSGIDAGDRPSNFMAMISALANRVGERAPLEAWTTQIRPRPSARGAEHHEILERVIRDCNDSRPVRRALAAIGEHHRAVLAATYGPLPQGMGVFGKLAGVVPLTEEARERWKRSKSDRPLGEWFVRLSWRAKHNPEPPDLAAVAAINRAAQAEITAAHTAFARAAERYRMLRAARRARAEGARKALIRAGRGVEE